MSLRDPSSRGRRRLWIRMLKRRLQMELERPVLKPKKRRGGVELV